MGDTEKASKIRVINHRFHDSRGYRFVSKHCENAKLR
jgi:hypothetical protein